MMQKDFFPKSISHKQLNTYLRNATPDKKVLNICEKEGVQDCNEHSNLLNQWASNSNKVLNLLKSRNQIFLKDKSSKSLMALGAMEAHLNMALQALKAAETG